MHTRHALLLIVSSLLISVPVFAEDYAATVELSETSGLIFADSIPGGELDYSVTVSPDGIRTLILDWDGSDSAPDVFDTGGLGGMDFTRSVEMTGTSVSELSISGGSLDVFDHKGNPVNPVTWHDVGAIRAAIPLADSGVSAGAA
nr:hypothetical protein [bacterium]